MPMMWLGKCVCVVLVVNIMKHSTILVQVFRYLVTCPYTGCLVSQVLVRLEAHLPKEFPASPGTGSSWTLFTSLELFP